MGIVIGCQTYSWEMLGDQWTGSVDDILDAVAEAGYRGIEITSQMIGEYAGRPKHRLTANSPNAHRQQPRKTTSAEQRMGHAPRQSKIQPSAGKELRP